MKAIIITLIICLTVIICLFTIAAMRVGSRK